MTQLTAFERKRQGSNLLAEDNFSLSAKQLKTGFLGIFNNKFNGDARKSFVKLALGAIMDTRAIPMGKPPKVSKKDSPEEFQKSKDRKNQMRLWEEQRAKERLYTFTELRKVNGADPYFVVSVPILLLGYGSLPHVMSLFGAPSVSPEAEAEFKTFLESDQNELRPAKLALANAGIDSSLETMLSSCFMGVRYKSNAGTGRVLASLDFKISKEEAEYLVSMDWLEIRALDLYPLLSMWSAAEFIPKFYGKRATSISKIASTLPPATEEDERCDKYGIGINLDGEPIYLPNKIDNARNYEGMFSSVGQNEDGTFSLGSLDAEKNKMKLTGLPINKPILIDWTNYKFSYTNSSGKIEIMHLEHVRKCNDSMAMNLLSRQYPLMMIGGWEGYAQRAGVSTQLSQYLQLADIDDAQESNYANLAPALKGALDRGYTVKSLCIMLETEFKRSGNKNYPTMRDYAQHNEPAFRFIWRFAHALYEGMKTNLDSLYVQYAVSTITNSLGWISLLANYGRDIGATFMAADTKNKAAADQTVDPNWTPPAAPLVTGKFNTPEGGLLPHQAKVRNLLKDSPDFAILSVAAGGGKSMLSITDILYEIKARRHSPYLIMCPSHLVANYVSEIVEFTDGKVNVLPITSYNVKTTGPARYEQMLDVAPINTIIVVDYDALKFRAKSTVYGTSATFVYPVVEMLRKFKPQYCMMDESHLLKNAKSARFKTVMSLIADIPKKRIASGTLNPDSPSDLAGQMAMLDPTIFGTKERFNEMFAEGDYKGGRVSKWKKEAGAVALAMIKKNCVWAEAKRKEWACALPPRTDLFIGVTLTPAQQDIYKALFDEMVLSIKKDAENSKNAKKLLERLNGKKASAEDEEDFADLDAPGESEDEEDLLDDENDVGAGLQPYLAQIEQFVSNPADHPYAKSGYVVTTDNGQQERMPPLAGGDLMSPKARKLAEVLQDHLSSSNSKALVFVNYNNTADSLFASMPAELQASGLLYKASEKTEMVNRFKNDPKIKWMIGIRKSLEVGLNLQQAGLLVRIEGVWTPGEQEQGDSRVERPYFGPGGDKREALKFITIVADKTIDVTKAARLRAKIIANAKFDNPHNPDYQAIESVPVFSMTLPNIQANNDFATNLAQYQTAMSQLNQVTKDEYEEYKQKIIAEGGFKFTQVAQSETPAEARLMARVPYAQGTELYSAANLGLIRVDNFLGTEMSGFGDEEEEEAEGEEEDTVVDPQLEAQRNLLLGMRCHTEYGEGEIVAAGAPKGSQFITRLRVKLDDDSMARALRTTNVFVVTRTETNGIDMRNAIAKASGLEVTADITVPAIFVRPPRNKMKKLKEEREERKKEKEEEIKKSKGKQLSVALHLSIVNGYMRLGYTPSDDQASKAMEALGFKTDQPYAYTLVRNAKQLLKQAQLWQEAGFNTTKEVDNDALALLHEELSTNALRTHRHYVKTVGNGGFANYLRRMWKPNPDKKLLNLFALVTDGGGAEGVLIRQAEKAGIDSIYGAAYLCLPLGGGFPATLEAIKPQYRAPGTKWFRSENEMSVFVSGLAAVHKVIDDLRTAGITVTNGDELNKQARSVKRAAKLGNKIDDLDLSVKEE